MQVVVTIKLQTLELVAIGKTPQTAILFTATCIYYSLQPINSKRGQCNIRYL